MRNKKKSNSSLDNIIKFATGMFAALLVFFMFFFFSKENVDASSLEFYTFLGIRWISVLTIFFVVFFLDKIRWSKNTSFEVIVSIILGFFFGIKIVDSFQISSINTNFACIQCMFGMFVGIVSGVVFGDTLISWINMLFSVVIKAFAKKIKTTSE